MYGVLIVDDERYVRLWVKNCIRWEDYGFEIIGEAEDGQEALGKIQELKPRLVISDMEMPDIDGAQLIEKAGALYPSVLFLVLSGYNTFEYMRSAVKNNAVDYLLKPVSEEDLVPVIEKIKNRLEQKDREKVERIRASIVVKENLEHKRERFFENLLEEHVLTAKEVERKLKELDIRFDGGLYNVLSIRFNEEAYMKESENSMDAELLKFSVANIAGEILEANKISSYFISRKNEVVSIVSHNRHADDGYPVLTGIYREIINYINTYLKVSVTVGMGNAVKDIMDIGASYAEARKSLDLLPLYGSNSVLTFLSVPANFNREAFTEADENSFAAAVSSLDGEGSKNILAGIFERLKKPDAIDVETVKMVYYRLISAILKEIYKAGITPSCLGMEEMDMFTAIHRFDSVEQIRDKLAGLVDRSMEGIRDTQKIKNSAVAAAQSYIMENFRKEITLAQISNVVHMTPNYFSSLFKAETGYTLLDYITRLRMEEVKSLMADKNLKTYEIGEMVGYKEPKYFCRVFKKMMGQSPLQYRKLHMRG
jgi:two-component system response regulator YesN